MSENMSENLLTEAVAAAKRAEEVARHSAGVDLAERLRAVEVVVAAQKAQLFAAAEMIYTLVEVMSGRRTD